ncbi:hypothetical protein EW146_g5770 [Bondarzewia mesenterica]|uniref:Kinesin motor domain-containing protein n=1 Tax=Bondarzewia mesenterica TaxID=1095465 RepID=A0A4S4LQH2_9AGAM|nr:hypothetical protein EW146_g5770 [Bondarzewia mesenterica]
MSQPAEQTVSNLDIAKSLQLNLQNGKLHIFDAKPEFNSKSIEGLEDWPGEGSSSGGARIPSAISADVTSHMVHTLSTSSSQLTLNNFCFQSFLRKLKFQYLEQNAKYQYVKTIVNDEAPMITADDNEELMVNNARKKEGLKTAKLKLAEKYQDVRRLAPLVEHGEYHYLGKWTHIEMNADYNRAKSLTNEAVTLAQSIIDARLAITRLRQTHPQPRLTIPTAEEHLGKQIIEMQELDEKLQEVSDKVAMVKESIKKRSKEVERLMIERAEINKEIKARGYGADDRRAASLCEAYTAALSLHRGLVDMVSSESVAENELRLTYIIGSDKWKSQTKIAKEVRIILLFMPTARHLVEVRVEGINLGDIDSIIGVEQSFESDVLFTYTTALMSHKIKIAARLRPRIKGELDDNGVRVVHAEDGSSSSICVTNPRDLSQVFKFPFTSCYDQASTQEDIFQKDVAPLIDTVYSGVTVTIFAYGVTSSGKTHTMQGTKSEAGVIPRTVQAILSHMSSVQGHEVSISLSYMEIYKDEVYDLLVDRDNAPKLPVRENDAGNVFVANLSSNPICTFEEFDSIYSRANGQRSVGATQLNRASSRSHAIVTLQVDMVDLQENKTLTGKINLVDLAGSENNKLTGNDSSRMAESAAINKSLSVLGQVVHALNQGAARIPYRNSKLTRILQDALGGSSVGLLICNLAPGLKFRQDTLNTLNFAVRTKNVENKPVINERDNRPLQKPHFAAVHQPPPVQKAAIFPALIAAAPRPSIIAAARPSLAPPRPVASSSSGLKGPSRVPRVSAFGTAGAAAPYPGATQRRESGIGIILSHRNSLQLTDKEIDERISKAVEAEVARRLEERERERLKEGERRAKEMAEAQAQAQSQTRESTPPTEQNSIPSGLLTPLLKRHQDLDNELRQRLRELEKKYERSNKEIEVAGGMSPISRKKTGRAYVALARAHSEKGDLHVALDLYRKAESYVPDNVKLKERWILFLIDVFLIIEIEWAVKNGKEFRPSPKKPRKVRGRKKGKGARVKQAREVTVQGMETVIEMSDEEAGAEGEAGPEKVEAEMGKGQESDDDDVVESLLQQGGDADVGRGNRKGRNRFGSEVTNSPTKRSAEDVDTDVATPFKKHRRTESQSRAGVSDDERVPDAPVTKECVV